MACSPSIAPSVPARLTGGDSWGSATRPASGVMPPARSCRPRAVGLAHVAALGLDDYPYLRRHQAPVLLQPPRYAGRYRLARLTRSGAARRLRRLPLRSGRHSEEARGGSGDRVLLRGHLHPQHRHALPAPGCRRVPGLDVMSYGALTSPISADLPVRVFRLAASGGASKRGPLLARRAFAHP